MKKILLLAGFLAFGPKPCYAGLIQDLIDNTKMTILDSGGPATFYDFTQGKSDSFRIGVIDHVVTYRFLNLDAY